MDKPHYIIKQHIKKYNNSRIINYRNKKQQNSLEKEQQQIMQEFIDHSDKITKSQRNVIDKYWGLSSIKQPDELYKLLKSIENKNE